MKKLITICLLITCLTSLSSFALEKCKTSGIVDMYPVSFHCLLEKPYIEGKPGDPFFPKRLKVYFIEAVYMKCVITPKGPVESPAPIYILNNVSAPLRQEGTTLITNGKMGRTKYEMSVVYVSLRNDQKSNTSIEVNCTLINHP